MLLMLAITVTALYVYFTLNSKTEIFSCLFLFLSLKDAAIVSPVSGTTRDIIEV